MKRIFGLDVLRALAIVIVVISHSGPILNNYTSFPFMPLPDGVDLFFVLSGFLVGGIFIRTVVTQTEFNHNLIFTFLKRRWYRTLPNYFLFLGINIVLIYFGLIPGTLNKFLSTYFVFFQNFFKPYDFLYWESWSLTVEEWFYLLLPLLFFTLIKLGGKVHYKPAWYSVIVILILFPLVFRILQSGQELDYDLYFRKLVLSRLDAIGFGVLAASVHHFYNQFWNRYKTTFFIIGFLTLVCLLSFNTENSFFSHTFHFSLSALAISLLLPALENLKNEPVPFKPVALLSKISYSLYLVHLPVLSVLLKLIPIKSYGQMLLTYSLFWVVSLLLSYFIYRFFEKPITGLRDR